ncbi:MAG TPA: Holliday junction resolvase RuvX [Flavobacteriales bacterium]|nr:Holliday junction resolvase RuvX [Flavobacteriales bacterium]
MSKILAIDYGLKRCGIAITDDAKMIASPLTTVAEKELLEFVKKQIETNKVDEIVIGLPTGLKGENTDATAYVQAFFTTLKEKHPGVVIELYDERFTSLLAQKSIHMMDLPKKKREQKGLLDKVSAAVLLQSYMNHKQFKLKNKL